MKWRTRGEARTQSKDIFLQSDSFSNMAISRRRRIVKSGSSSELEKKMVFGSHTFEIKGYSLTKGMGIGKYIESKKFNIGGCDWLLRFYPDGRFWKDKCSHVSVFIKLLSMATDVCTFYDLNLLDQRGNCKRHAGSHCIFDTSGNMWFVCFSLPCVSFFISPSKVDLVFITSFTKRDRFCSFRWRKTVVLFSFH